MRAFFIILLLATSAACKRSQAATPLQPDGVRTPAADTWTLAGQVIDAITNQPISGVQLLNTQTDSTGRFEVTGTGARSAQRATLAAQGFLTREMTIAAGSVDPVLDMIPTSLSGTYRELVRNGFEAPDTLEPLRRWTTAPKFYINTTMPIGLRVTETDLTRIEDGIRAAVPAFTGGLFHPAAIVRGTNPPANERGWIVVRFVNDSSADFCGRAYIAADPGEIEFNYNRCSCGSIRVRPRTIKHEVGHALGFWHAGSERMLMFGRGAGCGDADLTQEERDIARVAYTRAPLNADPDADPISTAPLGVRRRVVD